MDNQITLGIDIYGVHGMPGISSLRGQGKFHIARALPLEKSQSLWETLEGAPGATEAMANVTPACNFRPAPLLEAGPDFIELLKQKKFA